MSCALSVGIALNPISPVHYTDVFANIEVLHHSITPILQHFCDSLTHPLPSQVSLVAELRLPSAE
jgi:hypothetical protein